MMNIRETAFLVENDITRGLDHEAELRMRLAGHPAYELGRATAVMAFDPEKRSEAQAVYEAWKVNSRFVDGWNDALDWAGHPQMPPSTKQMYREEFDSLRQALGTELRVEAMAERSGDPELDALIEQFKSQNIGPDWGRTPNDYVDPNIARGQCHWASGSFMRFLRERGIKATMIKDTDLPNIGYENTSGQPGYVSHCVVQVVRDAGTYMVDWTPSQFGYKEFPMVQRLNDGGWQREWTAAVLEDDGDSFMDAPYEPQGEEMPRCVCGHFFEEHSEDHDGWYCEGCVAGRRDALTYMHPYEPEWDRPDPTEGQQHRWAATVEDTEPENNFGFMQEPHSTLYPCAWEGEKMPEKVKHALKSHVLNSIETEYQQPDSFIYFTVYGSGASYNWDEDGDFDIQMWVDMEKFNALHEDQHDKTQDDLLADIRRLTQAVNFPSFADLGFSSEDCPGKMIIQYYPKPGTGAASENLAQKPYACYDLETDEWIVRPKPLRPTFYGDAFLLVQPKCEDIAMQAEAAIDELQRNTINWQFWRSMWRRYKNPSYKAQFTEAQSKAEEWKECIGNLFRGVRQDRADAYAPEGKGIEDERDLVQKYLEVWGIFQKLRHFAHEPLPWEERELPLPGVETIPEEQLTEERPEDEESDEGTDNSTPSEEESEDAHEKEGKNTVGNSIRCHTGSVSGWQRTVKASLPQFFEDTTRGQNAPSTNLTPSFSDPGHQAFYDTYQGFAGHFDQHIETSIPDYREHQTRKGSAILKAFSGASVLDIGGSEGSWVKTLSLIGDHPTTNLEPNGAMVDYFNKNPVNNSDVAPNNFGEDFDPDTTYDIVNESMTFQFISPDRSSQLAEVKRLLSPGGVFLSDEKVITPNYTDNEQTKDAWKQQFYSPDQLAEKNKVVNFQGKPGTGMMGNMVTQEELETILHSNFLHVQRYWESGNFAGYVASDNPQAVSSFLIAYSGKTSSWKPFNKFADWDEVMQNATELYQAGAANVLNKMMDPETKQLHVIGEVDSQSSPGETYETEIWQDDPDSEAISLWSCDCEWGQKSWGRTRQWKKYEGRPCKHTLALYWQSLGTPTEDQLDYTQGEQSQGVPGQTTLPGMPPSGQTFEQYITQPAPTPGGPSLPTQTPVEQGPAPVMQQPAPPSFSVPKSDKEVGQLELPGTLSSWRRVYGAFQNGDTVRCNVSVQGIDRDGSIRTLPRNSSGEVLWSDEEQTIVAFPLNQSGRLEPHLVRVEAPTSVFYLSPSFNPGVRRRK